MSHYAHWDYFSAFVLADTVTDAPDRCHAACDE
jgi:hypothetical protein